jgi:hypothetical protein
MSYSSRPPESGGGMGPLSVGNVVSAAFRLYSSHLKSYLKISAIAHLWVLLPVYGWAKYAAKGGTLCRLAFGELTDRPESVGAADKKTDTRKWAFLGLLLLVALILVGVYFGLIIVGGIAAFIFGLLFAFVFAGLQGSALGYLLGVLLGIVFVIFVLLGISWFYARLIVAEVPLAVEEGVTVGQSLSRSWSLSESAVFRIQGVILVGFLITLPLFFVTNYLPDIFLQNTEPGSALYWTIYSISLIVSLIGSLILMPFWQALKAVLYFDLRSRREGFDLRLRER